MAMPLVKPAEMPVKSQSRTENLQKNASHKACDGRAPDALGSRLWDQSDPALKANLKKLDGATPVAMSMTQERKRTPEYIVAFVIVAIVIGHQLLNIRFSASTHTFVYLAWDWCCLAAGALAISRSASGSHDNIKLLRWSIQSFSCIAGVRTILYLLYARRAVDSVDLFYFLCESRDMLWGVQPWNSVSSSHFPGVYVFWKFVLFTSGGSFAAVQWAAILLLIANAAVTGTIVIRMTNHFAMGILSGVLYIVLCLRFEGLTGSREILCSLAFLVGTLLWLELAEIRNRLFAGSVAMGVGLGLALFCKQQAGLLSLGCLMLLFRRDLTELHPFRKAAWSFATITIAAVASFIALIFCQGKGLEPITGGLQWVARYERENSWLVNLLIQIRNDESFALLVAMTVFGCFVIPANRENPLDRRYHFVCRMLLLSAAATLAQYQARGYLHYTLLPMPALIIVFSVLLVWCWRRLSGGLLWQAQARVLLIVLYLLPLLYNGDRPIALDVTESQWYRVSTPLPVPWHEEEEPGRRIRELASVIPKRSEILLIPSGRNAVYFFLDGINSGGYAFKEMTPEIKLETHPPEYVILMPETAGWAKEPDADDDSAERLHQFISAGYQKIPAMQSVEVYQRPAH